MGFVEVCWFADLELATPDRGTQHSRFWARRASVDPTSPEHRHQQLLYFLGSGRVIFCFSEKSSTSGTNWRYSTPSSLAVWIKIPGGVTHPKNLPSCTKESTTSCVKCQVIKNDKCGYLPSWELTCEKLYWRWCSFSKGGTCFFCSLEFMLYPELMDQNGESTLENEHQWHWFDSWWSWLIDEICQIIRWCLPKASVNWVTRAREKERKTKKIKNPGCVEDQF